MCKLKAHEMRNTPDNQFEIDLQAALTKIMGDHGIDVFVVSYLHRESEDEKFGICVYGLASKKDLAAMHIAAGKSMVDIIGGKADHLSTVKGDMN